MFDIGFWEVSLLAVIGLIVLGPERLPVVARTLGGLVGRAKAYVRGLTSEIEREIDIDDLRSEVRRAREQIEATQARFETSARDTIDTVRETSSSAPSSDENGPARRKDDDNSAVSEPAAANKDSNAVTARATPDTVQTPAAHTGAAGKDHAARE